MKRIEVEEAAEYPLYASILPFEGKKYSRESDRKTAAETMTLTPFYAINFIEETINLN
ncbi:MAG: hypothetical protein J7K04_16060 [Spirochaetales bacterium]|nr:hypothetical protein [Spirochaetales bacterium]